MNLNFEQIYLIHGDQLLLYARTILGHKSMAEEVLQEAAVRILEAKSSNQIELSYVYSTLRHVALNMQRGEKREAIRRQVWARDFGVFTQGPSGASEEELEGLNAAIRELSEEQREVVMLKIWGELTFDKIGEILEISPNTAASRMRYAVEKIREMLGVENKEEGK